MVLLISFSRISKLDQIMAIFFQKYTKKFKLKLTDSSRHIVEFNLDSSGRNKQKIRLQTIA